MRLALQGGLSEYAAGLEYGAASDQFRATTDRELAPMFAAIFAGAPDGADSAYDYLVQWNDYLPARPSDGGTAASNVSQKLISGCHAARGSIR